jgi:hypothetical protein
MAPTETVAPGTIGRFNLALTRTAVKTLEALTTKKALTMTVSASATNVTGSPSTATSTVKLRGQRNETPVEKVHPRPKQPKRH